MVFQKLFELLLKRNLWFAEKEIVFQGRVEEIQYYDDMRTSRQGLFCWSTALSITSRVKYTFLLSIKSFSNSNILHKYRSDADRRA